MVRSTYHDVQLSSPSIARTQRAVCHNCEPPRACATKLFAIYHQLTTLRPVFPPLSLTMLRAALNTTGPMGALLPENSSLVALKVAVW